MALRFALLTALREQPATGYDLLKRFRARQSHVWNASHQQVYGELSKMQAAGLLTVEDIPQTSRPDRRLYRLTPLGERELVDWLQKPQPRPVPRDPFLLKLFAGDLLDRDTLAEEIQRLRRHYMDQLEDFREIEARWFANPGDLPRHYRLQYLSLRRGIRNTEDWLAWLDELTDANDASPT